MYEVPCGKCILCKREKSKAWGFRLLLESMYWDDAVFITLTYDNRTVPVCETQIEGRKVRFNLTLRKKDFQDFMKRLRARLDSPIRYYACGEYGEHTFRPHYHAIVFGLGQDAAEMIQDCWHYGIARTDIVNLATCNYVAGYIQKKLYGEVADEVYGSRLAPFSLMSKGLGKRYFLDHWSEMFRDGFILYKGIRVSIPRYFWKLMEKEKILPHFVVQIYKDDKEKDMKKEYSIEALRFGLTPYEYRCRELEKTRLKGLRLYEISKIIESRGKI